MTIVTSCPTHKSRKHNETRQSRTEPTNKDLEHHGNEKLELDDEMVEHVDMSKARMATQLELDESDTHDELTNDEERGSHHSW